MKVSKTKLKENLSRLMIKRASTLLARQAYHGVLDRAPDAGGMATSRALIEKEGSVEALVGSLVRSPEFKKKSFTAMAPEIVKAAYKGILLREADADGLKLHSDWLIKHRSIAGLLKHMTECGEFKRRVEAEAMHTPLKHCLTPLWYGRQAKVDITATPAQFEQIFERVRNEWTKLGETEPHWYVLTNDLFKTANFAKNEDEFYKSGEKAFALAKRMAGGVGLEINKAGTALELGCGTGRVTHVLAKNFARVIAVDVSPGNLKLCEDKMRALGLTNVEFLLLKSPKDLEGIPPIDFFFSTIVLQHNPPPVIHYMLDQIFGKLRPSGQVFFQVPTHFPEYSFEVDKYLKTPLHVMEMHCLPMYAVFALFAKHALMPQEVLMDTWTGWAGSHTFMAVRK
jgi:SAM-dependent methyltransferase